MAELFLSVSVIQKAGKVHSGSEYLGVCMMWQCDAGEAHQEQVWRLLWHHSRWLSWYVQIRVRLCVPSSAFEYLA